MRLLDRARCDICWLARRGGRGVWVSWTDGRDKGEDWSWTAGGGEIAASGCVTYRRDK